MASPSQRSVDLPILTFGGLVTQFDPQTLPTGASPYNRNVSYSGKNPNGTGMVAGWGSRPGTNPFFPAPFAGNPTVNYLKTFVDSTGVYHLLNLDNLGIMRDESPCPIPAIDPAVIGNVVAASIAQSDSLINREWIAIGDMAHPSFGIDIPRQWDSQFFDRVSQVGPGAPPTIADISSGLTDLSRTSGVISGTTAAPHQLVVGGLVTIQGVTADGTFNGTFPVLTVPTPTAFTAWGNPGTFTVSALSRTAGVVTATVAYGGQNISIGDTVVVRVGEDKSFTGAFVVTGVNGNTLTWAQVGPNAIASGGILYTAAATVAILGIYPAINPPSGVGVAEINVGENISQIPFLVGSQVTIANSDASYNGVQQLQAILNAPRLSGLPPYPNNTFIDFNSLSTVHAFGGTMTSYIADASPNVTGVAGPGGSIGAGLHLVSVSFVTREQYITKPAPFGFWTAGGNLQVMLSNIPTGPVNIIQRILIFTPVIIPPAIIGPFFYLEGVTNANTTTYPSMVIGDNTTTTAIIDFDDAVLQNGTPATYLFNLLELGECASTLAYSGRTFFAGERNKLPNLVNTTFDGGWALGSGSGGGDLPLGWSLIKSPGNSGGGGSKESADVVWGDAYKITADGAHSRLGWIAQNAAADYLGQAILSAGVAYSFRVRLKSGGTPSANGAFALHYGNPNGNLPIADIKIPLSTIPTNGYQEFILPLCGAQASIPANFVLAVDLESIAGGLVNVEAGAWVLIENLEIFPTSQPYNRPLIRGSYANDPESFDQSTGYLIIGQATEQSVRSMFKLIDNKMYAVTERGLYSTQDDGQNEPNKWTVNTVSQTVGTGSVRGTAVGESWAIIAAHDGVYIFWGGEPVKISQEIQPDWDTINWAYDQTIYVVVDTANKRIHIGAPTGTATSPNVEFVCDYAQLANSEGTVAAQDIASHPQAYYSVYNPTKVVAPGKARKWSIWTLSANSATLAVMSDGSYHLLRGNGLGTGKVYDQDPNALSDDGIAFPVIYQTAYFPQVEDEQALQLGSHRKLFKYLTGFAFGVGTMDVTVYGAMNQRAKSMSSLVLRNPTPWDFEMNANYTAERMSLLFQQNDANSWLNMTKLCPTIQRELITPVRGTY